MSFIPYLHLCIISIFTANNLSACMLTFVQRNLVKIVCVLHVSQEKLRHNVVLFITEMNA